MPLLGTTTLFSPLPPINETIAHLAGEQLVDPGFGVVALLGPDEHVDGGDVGTGPEHFLKQDLAHEACASGHEHAAPGVELGDGWRHVDVSGDLPERLL